MGLHTRFWSKVDMQELEPSSCWLWCASKTSFGYGQISTGTREMRAMVSAHRMAYEMRVGPIPDGLELDHLCRNPGCVNPDHLEPVTHRENVRRGEAGRHQTIKESCPQGHPYAGDNLYIHPNGQRVCRECQRVAGRRYYRRRHAQNSELPLDGGYHVGVT